MESEDPTVVRSVAVTAEDLVAAIEATRRSGRDAVLRITPPFSGRMRARLHVEGTEDYEGRGPAPVHLDPESLVEGAPAYPSPAETEDELRSDPDATYTRERHRERHEAAVEAWRASVVDHVVDSVELPVPGATHEVSVTLLG